MKHRLFIFFTLMAALLVGGVTTASAQGAGGGLLGLGSAVLNSGWNAINAFLNPPVYEAQSAILDHPYETSLAIQNSVANTINNVAGTSGSYQQDQAVGNIALVSTMFMGGAAGNAGRVGEVSGAGVQAARVGAGADTIAPGLRISTYRQTTAGENFYHYGYGEQATSFQGGLAPGGYSTSIGNLSGAEAQSGLALPRPTVPPERGLHRHTRLRNLASS